MRRSGKACQSPFKARMMRSHLNQGRGPGALAGRAASTEVWKGQACGCAERCLAGGLRRALSKDPARCTDFCPWETEVKAAEHLLCAGRGSALTSERRMK